ncbi:MAG: hypothetical protein IT460_09975 [Planctomycetes bacterium]|nr:hypothetical protein [Planctomycetota bacterium]
MRASLLGRGLVLVGGLLVVLGALLPEAKSLAGRWTDPATPHPPPDRSHLVVIREDVDMLTDPDDSIDAWTYDVWRAEAAGLGWLCAVGGLLAAGSFGARRRVVAALHGALHSAAWAVLAWLAYVVWRGAPEGGGGPSTLRRFGLWGAGVLGALALAEAALLVRAVRARPRGRLLPGDLVAALPATFLLAVGVTLYASQRGNPTWPADGYPVVAAGALAVLAGAFVRRAPRAGPAAPCPPPAPVARSGALRETLP